MNAALQIAFKMPSTGVQALRRHVLAQALHDPVAYPRGRNLLASLAACALLMVWAWWVAQVADRIGAGQSFFYKGHEYDAQGAPIFSVIAWVGSLLLALYSLLGAVQYAVEAAWRVRRMRGALVWPSGSCCLLSSRPVSAMHWLPKKSPKTDVAPDTTTPRWRWLLRGFGLVLVAIGAYLCFVLSGLDSLPPSMVGAALALLIGGGFMLLKPEVFRQ